MDFSMKYLKAYDYERMCRLHADMVMMLEDIFACISVISYKTGSICVA